MGTSIPNVIFMFWDFVMRLEAWGFTETFFSLACLCLSDAGFGSMPRYQSFFVYCNHKININIHCDDRRLKMLLSVAEIRCQFTQHHPHMVCPRDQYLKIGGFQGFFKAKQIPKSRINTWELSPDNIDLQTNYVTWNDVQRRFEKLFHLQQKSETGWGRVLSSESVGEEMIRRRLCRNYHGRRHGAETWYRCCFMTSGGRVWRARLDRRPFIGDKKIV